VVPLSLIVGVSLVLPDLDFTHMAPPLCWLGWNFALGHIREFARVVRALTFLAPALVSLEMINALLAIHPLNMDSPYLDSLLDF